MFYCPPLRKLPPPVSETLREENKKLIQNELVRNRRCSAIQQQTLIPSYPCINKITTIQSCLTKLGLNSKKFCDVTGFNIWLLFDQNVNVTFSIPYNYCMQFCMDCRTMLPRFTTESKITMHKRMYITYIRANSNKGINFNIVVFSFNKSN